MIESDRQGINYLVSIQLISLASRDLINRPHLSIPQIGFHSVNIPSE